MDRCPHNARPAPSMSTVLKPSSFGTEPLSLPGLQQFLWPRWWWPETEPLSYAEGGNRFPGHYGCFGIPAVVGIPSVVDNEGYQLDVCQSANAGYLVEILEASCLDKCSDLLVPFVL